MIWFEYLNILHNCTEDVSRYSDAYIVHTRLLWVGSYRCNSMQASYLESSPQTPQVVTVPWCDFSEMWRIWGTCLKQRTVFFRLAHWVSVKFSVCWSPVKMCMCFIWLGSAQRSRFCTLMMSSGTSAIWVGCGRLRWQTLSGRYPESLALSTKWQ